MAFFLPPAATDKGFTQRTAASTAMETTSRVNRPGSLNGGIRITVWRTLIVVSAIWHTLRQDFMFSRNDDAVAMRELAVLAAVHSGLPSETVWNGTTPTLHAAATENPHHAPLQHNESATPVMTLMTFNENSTMESSSSSSHHLHQWDTTATTGSKTTAWCVLGRHNTRYFVHFPHAMEFLSQCWSHYMRMVQEYPDTNIQCGIRLEPNMGWNHMAQWAKDLMHYANCTMVVSKEAMPESETLSYAPPFNASLEIGSIWFDRPDHAAALKNTVLSHDPSVLQSNHSTRTLPLPWTRTERLRIGLVIRPQRYKANRAFVNQDEIVQALSNVFAHAILTVVELGSLNMWQQAAFFASHDVVIAAHGAGLTNALFLRSDYSTPSNAATLIEVFPDDFESPMFRWLVAASGNARHVGMAYNNSAAPPSQGKDARHVDLRPNVSELVALVQDAVARQNTTRPYFTHDDGGTHASRTTSL